MSPNPARVSESVHAGETARLGLPGGSVVLVPLDDRPCTLGFARQLAPLVGWTLVTPPAELLGWCTTPGNPEALVAWLEAQHPWECALLSVDMLVFGGLVGSRSLEVAESLTQSRLAALEALLRRASVEEQGVSSPGEAATPAGRTTTSAGRTSVFDVVMRVPPYCTSDEDRRLSERLHEWSRLAARQQRGALGALGRVRLGLLERTLPAEFRGRYLQARARNHAVNRRVLAWPGEGLADFALMGMDDSRTEGFNVNECQALEALLPSVSHGEAGSGPEAGRGTPRGEAPAALLPGADELALLVLAREALHTLGRRPRLGVAYSPDSLRQRVTRYEDRGVEALVRAHCAVLGLEPQELTLASPVHGACAQHDLCLYVHGASRGQQEAATQVVALGPMRRHRQVAAALATRMGQGTLVAVADLGYANGGDRAFVQALCEAVVFPELAAYAGWNTAGNTVGTALAHAVLRWVSLQLPIEEAAAREATQAHVAFLLERLVDDVDYQAQVRQELSLACALRQLNVYRLGEAAPELRARAQALLKPLIEARFAHSFAGREVAGPGGHRFRITTLENAHYTLPWQRLFELACETRVNLEPASHRRAPERS